MTTQQKALFWISLTVVILALFRWLAGIAMPEIAWPFALGTTLILVSALFTGNLVTTLAIQTGAIKNFSTLVLIAILILVTGFIAIAFLLNAMIENTTLFPFAVTVLLLFIVTMSAGALVTIVRYQYKTKIQSAQAETAQRQSELQLLQSQLSPHFLFNTLNNLYGLSLHEPQRVPSLLLKLSDLLRYSVYDVKEMFVPLQHELDYIRNYIEFEKLRLGEKLDLTSNLEAQQAPHCKVPPLLLIVFVENAFKHSRTAGNERVEIHISLRIQGDQIVFSVSNSFAGGVSRQSQTYSGFGLESVRRRLNLLYARRHTLRIDQSDNRYHIHLEFPCQ